MFLFVFSTETDEYMDYLDTISFSISLYDVNIFLARFEKLIEIFEKSIKGSGMTTLQTAIKAHNNKTHNKKNIGI